MDIKECIINRRSIRQFTAKPVAHETIAEIINEASYSPSWKNTQIVRYIAVEGALKEQIANECTSAYHHNGEIILEAPMLIVLAYKKGRSGFERDGSYSTTKEGGWQMFDSGIAAQTFCLSAYSHGLGTVIMGIFDAEKVASYLSLSEDMEVCALIPIGYPNEVPSAPKRKAVDELLSYQS